MQPVHRLPAWPCSTPWVGVSNHDALLFHKPVPCHGFVCVETVVHRSIPDVFCVAEALQLCTADRNARKVWDAVAGKQLLGVAIH